MWGTHSASRVFTVCSASKPQTRSLVFVSVLCKLDDLVLTTTLSQLFTVRGVLAHAPPFTLYCQFAMDKAAAAASPAITTSLDSINVPNGALDLGWNSNFVGVSEISATLSAVLTENFSLVLPILIVVCLSDLTVSADITLTWITSQLTILVTALSHAPPFILYSPHEILTVSVQDIPVIVT